MLNKISEDGTYQRIANSMMLDRQQQQQDVRAAVPTPQGSALNLYNLHHNHPYHPQQLQQQEQQRQHQEQLRQQQEQLRQQQERLQELANLQPVRFVEAHRQRVTYGQLSAHGIVTADTDSSNDSDN
jgi:hypothetical protein